MFGLLFTLICGVSEEIQIRKDIRNDRAESAKRCADFQRRTAAADWLSKELIGTTKAQEMLAHRDAMIQFGVQIAATNSHVKDKENILHCLL